MRQALPEPALGMIAVVGVGLCVIGGVSALLNLAAFARGHRGNTRARRAMDGPVDEPSPPSVAGTGRLVAALISLGLAALGVAVARWAMEAVP